MTTGLRADWSGEQSGKRREPIMRFLIKVLVVLLICLVGIGFYRGWFSVSSPNPDADKVNVNVSVDKGKMKSDVKEAEQKVKEEIKEIEGKAKEEKK
jgi:uncharacterized membrane protein YjgN (DUF898 family)